MNINGQQKHVVREGVIRVLGITEEAAEDQRIHIKACAINPMSIIGLTDEVRVLAASRNVDLNKLCLWLPEHYPSATIGTLGNSVFDAPADTARACRVHTPMHMRVDHLPRNVVVPHVKICEALSNRIGRERVSDDATTKRHELRGVRASTNDNLLHKVIPPVPGSTIQLLKVLVRFPGRQRLAVLVGQQDNVAHARAPR